MKKLLCTVACALSVLSVCHAQQSQPNLGCLDKVMVSKADDIKRGFARQGMTVYREAMMGMDPDNPFPVGVKLERGHLYQLLFIANQDAKSSMLELYDGDDNKIAEKKLKANQDPGYIIYSFVPEKTDMYLVVLSQLVNTKTTCGNFTIMEKDAMYNTAEAPVQISQPAYTQPVYTQPSRPATKYADNTPADIEQHPGMQTPQPSNSNRYIGNVEAKPAAPANTGKVYSNRYVGETPAQPVAAPAADPQPVKSNRYIGNAEAQPAVNTPQPSYNSNRYVGNTADTKPAPATPAANPQPVNSNRYIGNAAESKPAPAAAPQPSNSNRYVAPAPAKSATTTNSQDNGQTYHSNRYIGNDPVTKPAPPPPPPPAPKSQYGNQVPNSNRYLGSDIDKK